MTYTTTFAKKLSCRIAGCLLALLAVSAAAQITPSADSYTNTASGNTNYGAKTDLDVQSGSQTTYIQFDLSSIPSGFTGSNVAKASLKLYLDTVTTAGSLNVDFVNGAWSENTITADLAPALGTTIAASVPIAKSNAKDYILIDITSAVEAWLNGTQANDGIALVGNSPINVAFDSKESTTTSHPPELDIVFSGGGGGSGITGVLTGSSSGLTGGGTSGTLNLSLLTSCAKTQVLAWNGSAWACSNTGTGTVTGVTAGTDLTGGGTGGNVTLNLDTTKVPQLTGANSFTNLQSITASPGGGQAALRLNNSGQGYSLYSNSSGTYNIWANGGEYGIVAYGQAFPVTAQTASGSPAVYAESDAAGSAFGVQAVADSDQGSAVYGVNGTESTTGTHYGNSAGVWGDAGNAARTAVVATADDAHAVLAYNNSLGETIVAVNQTTAIGSFGNGFGLAIAGNTQSANGIGIAGATLPSSGSFGDMLGAAAIGVSGDTGVFGGIGVLATEDTGYALWAQNESSYTTSIFLNYANATSDALYAGNLINHCTIDNAGDLVCTGNMSGAVQQGNRAVRLYAVQSPENWFEDFGSGTLSGGSATVTLDPGFAQTVNTTVDYHVFITPNGESEGLYVANKTAGGFEVREQHGGHSNIAFDYRIVGRRKGYENVRLEDITERQNLVAAQNQRLIMKSNPGARQQMQKQSLLQPHAPYPGGKAPGIATGSARQSKGTLKR